MTNSVMKALVLNARGEPETLSIAELAIPSPGPGEVRLKVEACGLNPSDYQRAKYGVPEWEWPAVLGLDIAGTVHEVGAEVSGFKTGDRVTVLADIRARGGFAEYALANASALALIPDGVTFEQAAALPAAGMTAYEGVERLQIRSGEIFVTTGAAGAVGGFAAQLANLRGAVVVGIDAGRHRERAKALGCTHFIDFQTEDVAEKVKSLTRGKGAHAILDTVGSPSATEKLALLGFGGRMATTAGRPDMSAMPQFTIAPSVHELALGATYIYGDAIDRKGLSRILSDLLALVADGKLNPMIGEAIDLSAVPTGLRSMMKQNVTGKLVYSRSLD